MPTTAEPLKDFVVPTLQELREQAQQLAELANRLSGSPPAEAPGTPPGVPAEDARSLTARLLQQAGHRTVRVQSSYAEGPHESRDPLLRRLHNALLAQGAEIRVLAPSRLLKDEEAFARLTELAASGARIRLHPCDLPTATVFDGRVGLLGAERGAAPTVINDPEFARALSALHNAVWLQAVELGSAHADWTGDESAVRVLRVVSQGYTDEKAARVLGLSVRTYRRHVAALLSRLNATSRFQAGVRAAQLGLIDAPV
ncbi:LuxR C-terminal-related transcriptional regulator [Streptomyces sp. NPDC035033]|uniref:helix-turn-helix transcriptional regulator n=1 Tax=Streptomyces sp. NPDC035033 TaxID=3155368 RepID=UPI0033E4D9F9